MKKKKFENDDLPSVWRIFFHPEFVGATGMMLENIQKSLIWIFALKSGHNIYL